MSMILPKKKKLLHIVDDSFFTDFIIQQFEKANPGFNDYVILCPVQIKIRYIKNISDVQIIKIFSFRLLKLVFESRNYQALMFHMLTPLKAWLAIFNSIKTKLVWFDW